MMAKKKTVTRTTSDASPKRTGLGAYLWALREAKNLSLREVEDATNKAVSNAYLSQLENGKIAKPAPSVLHDLALVYAIPYERLMEKAGYLPPTSTPTAGLRSAGQKRDPAHGKFAVQDLTEEEEAKLLEYLGYLRSRK